MKKSIPIIQEWESEAFILGNGREREFPLTPDLVIEKVSLKIMTLVFIFDGVMI